MPPASWPVFCRSWARVTEDMAGMATASIRAATAIATPISISVMPVCRRPRIRALLPHRGSAGSLSAVDVDVVATALRLVGPVRVHVVAVAAADVRVVLAPGILADLAHVLGDQLLEAVGPLAGVDVVEVDAVRETLQVELRGLDLRILELPEDVEPDRAGDQPEDHQHHHDLDQRHAARRALPGPALARPPSKLPLFPVCEHDAPHCPFSPDLLFDTTRTTSSLVPISPSAPADTTANPPSPRKML